MATMPAISDASLTPTGRVVTQMATKKPVYSVTQLGTPRPSTPFREPLSPSRRPKHVRFGAVVHPKIRIVRPIPIEISYEKQTVIARFRDIEEFGCGSSTSLALEDLGKTIAELFLELQAQKPKLGPDLQRIYLVLRRHLASRER